MTQLSIIIPLFNKEPHIHACLESALEFGPDCEVIVVNDGSTDKSVEAMGELVDDPRVNLIHQENRGLSGARNTGFRAAQSEHVFFHDADDLVKAEGLHMILEEAQLGGNEVTGGCFERSGPNGVAVDRAFMRDEAEINFRNEQDLALHYCTHFSSCNKVYRRDFLQDWPFTEGLYMQDIELWLRMMFSGFSFTQLAVPVATYQAFEDSWSRTRSPGRWKGLFELFNNLDSHYQEQGWQEFAPIKDYALLQGAFGFFMRWKLEDNNREDLESLAGLLDRMGEETIFSFYHQKNKGQIAPLAQAMKQRNWDLGRKILSIPNHEFRKMAKSFNAPCDMIRFSESFSG
ncbi:glycosyltransferase family 2 protein [Hyphobacterium sp. CCMP332]|uniref:glycosyltransferase family 2 protein n=1 Tax=Hyphobacterium sp. CCMP332 TaxID=2749086 RepID=UPI0016503F1D|nr:glycosyltransferase family 2 protein [Hyphobacterium sp. CCMP332]QNL17877.1 glycosyltransferase family 2 protein [Hyphobacterium sp. CCMP332]